MSFLNSQTLEHWFPMIEIHLQGQCEKIEVLFGARHNKGLIHLLNGGIQALCILNCTVECCFVITEPRAQISFTVNWKNFLCIFKRHWIFQKRQSVSVGEIFSFF